MAELPLDVGRALALLEQQRDEGVPKPMGGKVEREPGTLQHPLEGLVDVGGVERRAGFGSEDPGRQLGPSTPQYRTLEMPNLKSNRSERRPPSPKARSASAAWPRVIWMAAIDSAGTTGPAEAGVSAVKLSTMPGLPLCVR
jgi:hypothetical protein